MEGRREGVFNAQMSGTHDIEKGNICTYDISTGLCTLACDETQPLYFALSSGLVAEKDNTNISLMSVKTINWEFWAKLSEVCSRGDSLYLDEQANEAAATGKLKKTPGNAKVVLAVAKDALTDTTGKIPVVPYENQEPVVNQATEGLLATVGGAVTIPKGSIVNYNKTTGVATLAYAETSPMYYALSDGAVGAEIRIIPLNKVGVYYNPISTEVTAVGDALYLDEQADLANATGKVKKTAGDATLAIFYANAIAVSDNAVEAYSAYNDEVKAAS